MTRRRAERPSMRREVLAIYRRHVSLIAMLTPRTCIAARALTGLTQKQLAERAKLTWVTINKFEKGRSTPHRNNLLALQRELEAAGAAFIAPGDASLGGGHGVRLTG